MSRPRVLAICTTAMGDVLLSVPAMEALGRSFRVEVLVHVHRLGLLRHNPWISRLIPYRNNPFTKARAALSLIGRKYHRVVIMHANEDILGLIPLLRFDKGAHLQSWDLSARRIESLNLPEHMHIVDKRIRLAMWAGANPVAPRIRVYLQPQELSEAEVWLKKHGLGSRARVVLCPGAANLFKCWPAHRYGQVARVLADKGIGVVLIGAKGEEELLSRVEQAAGIVLPRVYHVPLRKLAAIIACAQLIITNDTGPLHLAQGVQTPVLGLFGPTDPDRVGPREPIHRVLKVPPTCNPCLTKRCLEPRCMEALEVEQVLATALEMLEGQR